MALWSRKPGRDTDWGVDVLDLKTRRRLTAKQRASRWSVSLERLTPAIWAPFGLLLLALALSASGFWGLLPGWLHLGALALIVVAALVLFVRALVRFTPASEAEALKRLEGESGLHRPLTAVRDEMALGRADPAAAALWQAHRRQMAARVGALKVPLPQPDMPRHDPFALRFAAVFLCLLGFAIGGTQIGDHLQAAITPPEGSAQEADPIVLEAWITPPVYTGQPPIFITSAGDDATTALQVPANSRLLARFHGDGDVSLAQGEEITAFERMTERDMQLDVPLTRSGEVAIRQGSDDLGRWNVTVIPDAPPLAEITEEPQPTMRGALRIAYGASDDYGVTSVAMRLKRLGTDEEVVLELPLPGRRQKKITDVIFRDLTDHRWAGLPVEMVIEVMDDPGQVGRTAPVKMLLPSRQFQHPVARAVVEQRRKLIEDPVDNRPWVVRAIQGVQINPETYNADFAVHLMLSLARSDLRDNRAEGVIAATEELLWRTALRIEDGQLAVALSKLRDLQDKLLEALANGASEEEIQRLMDELQQAMDEYLQAMQQQAIQDLKDGNNLPDTETARQLEQRQLNDLLDQARELSRSGSREKAREMLSQLQEMLENLQMGNPTQSSGAEQNADQMMDDLGRLMEQQQQLRDRTFERQQRQQNPDSQRPTEQNPFGAPPRARFPRSPNVDTGNPSRGGEPGDSSDEDLKSAQERLRNQLRELMQQLAEGMGDVPSELGEAEGAMRDAEQALQQGNRQGALGSQSEALDRLRKGTESVLEDLANRGNNAGPNEQGAGQTGLEGEETDPLGRAPTESWGDPKGEIVPGAGALQQSREILDELRKRSGQRHRSILERDYIQRLLKQF